MTLYFPPVSAAVARTVTTTPCASSRRWSAGADDGRAGSWFHNVALFARSFGRRLKPPLHGTVRPQGCRRGGFSRRLLLHHCATSLTPPATPPAGRSPPAS